jgi:hypothetical protein
MSWIEPAALQLDPLYYFLTRGQAESASLP